MINLNPFSLFKKNNLTTEKELVETNLNSAQHCVELETEIEKLTAMNYELKKEII
nr:MAG TPA: Shugoshin N-terminal coiled-coil region [Caudoviricetes sp.]